ncbi:MAG: nucleotidyl transferase AbiEii/AbiGii toxin family protein [Acidobacteriota bacterium]|jgi:predicted nucleotidyltransferase component of viral defense system|nr:nucleotidyl transferase AbiEii/AbiGii toxin family protein [Acidobacteriota bacterium]
MTSRSQYYEKSLYPLQDGVLRAVKSCGTRFYLTGGTALSRAYYHHRYSDDLDFFVNADPDFDEQVDAILAKLRADGFVWDASSDFVKDVGFRTLQVRREPSGTVLKLDFVNDVAPHFGGLQAAGFFDRIDSVRNILSNKLGAVFRLAGKDVADIREIAIHESVDWAELIDEARQKDGGIELPHVAEILKNLPRDEFEAVRWIEKPDWETFKNDIHQIVFNMMNH